MLIWDGPSEVFLFFDLSGGGSLTSPLADAGGDLVFLAFDGAAIVSLPCDNGLRLIRMMRDCALFGLARFGLVAQLVRAHA